MNSRVPMWCASVLLAMGLGLAAGKAPGTAARSGAATAATATAAAPRAARSVHLRYGGGQAGAFYNEVTVRQTVPGSYFECCGFDQGYFGIQETVAGKKIAIFSVWDPTAGDQAGTVPTGQQVEILYQGKDVTVKRFGGEGTGGQSLFDFDWQAGQTYRFLVTAKTEAKKTAFGAYLYLPESQSWKHLATMRTPTKGEGLSGLYSFIEDFRRDTRSALEVRRAEFGNGWMVDAKGQWQALTQATFTASGADWEDKKSIDMGVIDGRFFLQTGGSTIQTTKLNAVVKRVAGKEDRVPEMPGD